MTQIAFSVMQTPMGPLTLTCDAHGLLGVHFDDDRCALSIPPNWMRDDQALRPAAAQLAEYFERQRNVFDLPLSMGGTRFQRTVWQALLQIPYGSTMSYGELASRIDAPGSARAVGGANGRNPIAIVVPCHRVIGADGSLTGYGGGEHRKKWLLEFERGVGDLAHGFGSLPVAMSR